MNTPLPNYPRVNPEMEPWISATQISNFELCPRKWAWRWLEHVKAPPNKFAQLGIDTHGPLEKWLKFGEVPDATTKPGKLALELIPLLPPPQAVDYQHNRNVERDELLIVDDGAGVVLFIIKVDLHMPSMQSWDGAFRPRTYDHKTSKDPQRWAPKPSEIQYDPQAALYAAWTIVKTGSTIVDLQWNYVKTVGHADTFPVYATVTDEMITPRMRANLETGRAIKHHLLNTKRALDVAQDLRACDEYGGCPYKGQEYCAISAKERIVTIMNDFKNQPATQQFLQGVAPTNGAVNPPQFQQPPTFQQQQPQGQPQFQQQPPAFQPPPGQFSAPMPQPSQPSQFQQPPAFQPQAQPPAFQQAQSSQFQPQAQPPQFQPQPQQPPPMQQQPMAFQQQPQPAQQAPQFGPPQPAPAQQFVPPGAQPQQEPAKREVGRPKASKEYDMTGAWAIMMSGAIQLTAGDARAAALIADQALVELKARQ